MKFKVGDRVVVRCPASMYNGQEGVVMGYQIFLDSGSMQTTWPLIQLDFDPLSFGPLGFGSCFLELIKEKDYFMEALV